jgi:hypothetical protein
MAHRKNTDTSPFGKLPGGNESFNKLKNAEMQLSKLEQLSQLSFNNPDISECDELEREIN